MQDSRTVADVDRREDAFTVFVRENQDRTRHALVAGFGVEVGREAAEETLVHAWQHWDKDAGMRNPEGYVYRVGHRMAQKMVRVRRRPAVFPVIEIENEIGQTRDDDVRGPKSDESFCVHLEAPTEIFGTYVREDLYIEMVSAVASMMLEELGWVD